MLCSWFFWCVNVLFCVLILIVFEVVWSGGGGLWVKCLDSVGVCRFLMCWNCWVSMWCWWWWVMMRLRCVCFFGRVSVVWGCGRFWRSGLM